MERLNTAVADELYAVLGRRRISLAELSRRTGINQGTLWRRLNGPYALSLDDLAAISRALDLPITSLTQ